MPNPESSTGVAFDSAQQEGARARKRPRPLTVGQEALFFGVTFTIALALQLIVLLKVANVLAW